MAESSITRCTSLARLRVSRPASSYGLIGAVVLAFCIANPAPLCAETRSAVLASQVVRVGRDSFPHSTHEKLPCLGCHETGATHGRLRFERPLGCAACHHDSPTPAKCATCHRTETYAYPRPVTVTITVPRQESKPRTVQFRHEVHAKRSCLDCHTTPVTLRPGPTKVGCKDCHEDHHAAGRSCSTCHTLADPKVAHKTADTAHQRCDACHTATTVARLTPTRSLCSVCHANKGDHYAGKECTVCHFLSDPASYRSRLVTRGPP